MLFIVVDHRAQPNLLKVGLVRQSVEHRLRDNGEIRGRRSGAFAASDGRGLHGCGGKRS